MPSNWTPTASLSTRSSESCAVCSNGDSRNWGATGAPLQGAEERRDTGDPGDGERAGPAPGRERVRGADGGRDAAPRRRSRGRDLTGQDRRPGRPGTTAAGG